MSDVAEQIVEELNLARGDAERIDAILQPLHASAKELRNLAHDVAVTYHATALHLHSFDNCDQRLCVRARAVLAEAEVK